MIQLVPVLLVDQVWPDLKAFMAIACDKGGGQYTEGWLHTLCRKGDAYLVIDRVGDDVLAGVVCQEQNWSGRTVLNILACGGMEYNSSAFIEYARSAFNVDGIVFEGRKGWQKTPGVRLVRCVYEMGI